MEIEKEIHQRSFESENQKVHVNILFTASWLGNISTDILKPYEISWQQFNVLRILRGLYPETASIKLLTERMVDKMSNASRLVEKLRKKGLVERHECPQDRRQVEVRITLAGLEIIEKASTSMRIGYKDFSKNLSEEELKVLNALLDRLRG